MSRTSRILFFALLVSFTASLGPAAQASGPPIRPPRGSYSQSCNMITFDGYKLLAHCADGTGRWYMTSLMTADCSGDISNMHGHLYCNGGQPGGSYLGSCYNVSYVIDYGGKPWVEAATCWNGSAWHATWLNPTYYGLCVDEVANVLGNLSCDLYGTGEVSPAGSYRQSCVLLRYFDPSGGDYLEASCLDMSGYWDPTYLSSPGSCKSDISNNNGQLTCQK